MHKATHVVGEVLHPDLGLGANHADRAHQGAAHVVGLRAEDVLDPDPHRRFGPVAARYPVRSAACRVPLRWMWLVSLAAFSFASISSDR